METKNCLYCNESFPATKKSRYGYFMDCCSESHENYYHFTGERISPCNLKSWQEYQGIEVKTKMQVCPRCDGKGHHTNPSIDGNGISAEEFYNDPDFAEDYFSGVYDVPCYECGGENVTPVVDLDSLTKEQREDLIDWQLGDEETRAIEAAERRFGA